MVRFAQDAGDAMDHDFVAVLVFAVGPARPVRGTTICVVRPRSTRAWGNRHLERVLRRLGRNRHRHATKTRCDRAEETVLRVAEDPLSTSVAARRAIADAGREKRLRAVSEFLSEDSSGQKAVVNPFGHPQSIQVADSFVPDVPAFGVAWLGDPPPHPPAPLAEDLRLQNEFVQVEVDRVTGAIRGIGGYARRGPAVAQQIAFFDPGVDTERGLFGSPEYTVMAADSVRVTMANAACGEIEVCGRLLARDGQRIADFRQRTRLPRASRIVLVEGEIHLATRARRSVRDGEPGRVRVAGRPSVPVARASRSLTRSAISPSVSPGPRGRRCSATADAVPANRWARSGSSPAITSTSGNWPGLDALSNGSAAALPHRRSNARYADHRGWPVAAHISLCNWRRPVASDTRQRCRGAVR